MDRPPDFLGDVFSRVGSGDQNNHQIEADRPQRDKQRFITRVKRNENIFPPKGNELVKKQCNAVKQGEYERLQRDPAMKIEAAQSQKIFPDSRQTRNRSHKNGNIEKQKTDESARADNIPVPGDLNVLHKALQHSMLGPP